MLPSIERRAVMTRSVAELCQDQGLTVSQVAERAQLEESRVLAIALGRWTPSPAERQKIAAVFGISISDITWGHNTPIQHLYGHGPG
jgi:transcriptional regulator with XRE-family HTH domain